MDYLSRNIRNPWARQAYMHIMDDDQDKNSDPDHWYDIDLEKIDYNLRHLCVKSTMDQETRQFIDSCCDASILKNIFDSISSTFLHALFSQTTTNGLLGRGSMHIFGRQQFLTLVGKSGDWRIPTMLDLGAGDGNITSVMAEFVEKVSVTEVSKSMRWRLNRRGYQCVDAFTWPELYPGKFDLISCLNVLDRTDRPLTLLSNIKKCLKPGNGICIIAVVVPVSCYVESGWFGSNTPSEELNVSDDNFEECVNSLIQNVFNPAGFTVVNFTRLPYLCQGDLYENYYVLNDSIFVLKSSIPVTHI
ncbi:uncharacterized protein TRIADDRAFT_55668 [Trichoplax adhaerens]|uniref:Methyltransferase-like protein 9 n=1 Tax=Trichoplax adhaerens TaxID=10228 RepID=B3RVI8_TRIAD|nr:hypothetical protein TRIADDRAFT_55668 [Trichoplax adhaerens]EDV25508.1 hypothetical protein TRIADDRAFT_55668 [Trichoplax adhaerens]|eukprot:XP_002111541.1 hypothetical protein TRIADDRAFT_55668 [Trichoplax adhaerens]